MNLQLVIPPPSCLAVLAVSFNLRPTLSSAFRSTKMAISSSPAANPAMSSITSSTNPVMHWKKAMSWFWRRKRPPTSWGPATEFPSPEVDRANQAYDTRVCGIVAKAVDERDLPPVEVEQQELPQELEAQAMEAQAQMAGVGQQETTTDADPYEHPLQQLAPTPTENGELTQVAHEKLGKMVTLGAFAYCKVDADIGSIAPGDLLTTSPTKGHAQKVLQPEKALGAIVGKALAGLEAGRGKIPILVLLQ